MIPLFGIIVPAFFGTNNSVVLLNDPSGFSPTKTGSFSPTSPPLFRFRVFKKVPKAPKKLKKSFVFLPICKLDPIPLPEIILPPDVVIGTFFPKRFLKFLRKPRLGRPPPNPLKTEAPRSLEVAAPKVTIKPDAAAPRVTTAVVIKPNLLLKNLPIKSTIFSFSGFARNSKSFTSALPKNMVNTNLKILSRKLTIGDAIFLARSIKKSLTGLFDSSFASLSLLLSFSYLLCKSKNASTSIFSCLFRVSNIDPVRSFISFIFLSSSLFKNLDEDILLVVSRMGLRNLFI